MNPWLVCGVAGPALDQAERRMLRELSPGGVVLFARNVVDADQLRRLVDDLRELPGSPPVAVDLEGGRVNRLEPVTGTLPSPAAAAAAGEEAVRALGEAAGAACSALGIGIDYAPAVDVARPGGWLAAEDRCLADTPAGVTALARVFLTALEAFGVGGCLKHYPGLGSGAVDSHRTLPELGGAVISDRDVFEALAAPGRAVMVAHAMAPGLGDPFAPASLSRAVVGPLARGVVRPVIADDLEMGALDRFGTLGERAAAALLAGCHRVLVCNALEERRRVVDHVARWADRDAALAAALERAAAAAPGFGRGPLAATTAADVRERCDRARTLAEVTR